MIPQDWKLAWPHLTEVWTCWSQLSELWDNLRIAEINTPSYPNFQYKHILHHIVWWPQFFFLFLFLQKKKAVSSNNCFISNVHSAIILQKTILMKHYYFKFVFLYLSDVPLVQTDQLINSFVPKYSSECFQCSVCFRIHNIIIQCIL